MSLILVLRCLTHELSLFVLVFLRGELTNTDYYQSGAPDYVLQKESLPSLSALLPSVVLCYTQVGILFK